MYEKNRSQKFLPWVLGILIVALALWGGFSRTKSRFRLPVVRISNTSPPEVKVSNEVLNLQESFANLADAVKPAVVNISIVQILKIKTPFYEFQFGDPFENFFEDFFGSPNRRRAQPQERYYQKKAEGTGSGVIIDPRGYVLTNYHVIAGATDIKVTLSDDSTYNGKIIGKDPQTDLAVVKIAGRKEFPYARLGDSDRIRIGDWAVAIGSPFGLQQTVTAGIISAKRQSLSIEGRTFKEMIQTDASINRGNSGGPLVNIRGEVIGINTAIYAPTGVFSGVGFAIPINKARAILDELIKEGKVTRGWLGIEIKPVDKVVASQFGLSDVSGALVNRVMENSAASRGGIMRGDVIVDFNGTKIKDPASLQDVVSSTKPGSEVNVTVIRNRAKKVLKLKLAEMPVEAAEKPGEEETEPRREERAESEAEWLGMTVKPLNDKLAREYQISNTEKGVVVVAIKRGGEAENMGLSEGDLIKAINQQATDSVDAFNKVTGKIKVSSGVMFDIIRRGHPVYITYSGTGE